MRRLPVLGGHTSMQGWSTLWAAGLRPMTSVRCNFNMSVVDHMLAQAAERHTGCLLPHQSLCVLLGHRQVDAGLQKTPQPMHICSL